MKLRLYVWLMKRMYRIVWVGLNKIIDDMKSFQDLQDDLEDEMNDIYPYMDESKRSFCD